MKKLISLQDAARLLNVHPETLRRWDKSGKLVAEKIGGREDRWYRQEDLLKIKLGSEPEQYEGFTIMPYSQGFEISPGTLLRIASFVVTKDDLVTGFAFTDGGMLLRMSHPYIKDESLIESAKQIIRTFIDENKIKHLEEYTFEFYPTNYLQVNEPKWWTQALKKIYGTV